MKIVIVGAGGFLGTALLDRLAGSDAGVAAVSSQAERLEARYAHAENIRVLKDIGEIPAGADVLLNCAFPRSGEGGTVARGLQYIYEVLQTAVRKRLGAVVNISSQSVYDQRRTEAADEDSPPKPESVYAVGKYASELLTESMCSSIRHTNIRLASLVGRGFEQRVLNRMIRKAAEGETLRVMGGKQIFGYMDIQDAADALETACRLIGEGPDLDPVYNLGSGTAYTLAEIVDAIGEVAGELEPALGVKAVYEKGDDVMNSSIISDRFYRKFNWRPTVSMKETIRDLFDSVLFPGENAPWNREK